jgi:hypothetical protein
MNPQSSQPLAVLWEQIQAFLPTLAAGLLVLALGVLLGWLAKRGVIRLLIWLRLDRLAGRAGWRAAFGKGDVRSTLYNIAGNITMLLIVLVFLDDTLERWDLLALSRLIDSVVFYLPNLVLAGILLGIGLTAANALAARLLEVLEEEGVMRPKLIAMVVKASRVGIVVAIILWQLRLAREMVLAAFLIGFGAVGVAFALGIGLGSYRAIERGLGSFFKKDQDE